MVERSLSMREVPGSIPRISTFFPIRKPFFKPDHLSYYSVSELIFSIYNIDIFVWELQKSYKFFKHWFSIDLRIKNRLIIYYLLIFIFILFNYYFFLKAKLFICLNTGERVFVWKSLLMNESENVFFMRMIMVDACHA